MKKKYLIGLSILLLSFASLKISGQNVLKSAYNIMKLKETKDPVKLELFDELARYVKPGSGKTLGHYLKVFSFKSAFLETYLTKVFISDSLLNEEVSKNSKLDFNTIKSVTQSTVVLKFLDSLEKTRKGTPKTSQLALTIEKLSGALKSYTGYKYADRADSLRLQKEMTIWLDSLQKMELKKVLVNIEKIGPKIEKTLGKNWRNSLSGAIAMSPAVNANTTFEITNISNIAKAAGIPSQNDIIDALAIFLVKRVKEESVIAFLEHLNANMDKLQPLPCLFPNTAKELASFQVGEAERFGGITQKAIAVDLAQMPDNIMNCGFCEGTGQLRQYKPFSGFFNDLGGGVDLITNISYYANEGQQLLKDTSQAHQHFISAMRLLHFINKYYSNIYEPGTLKNQPVWIGPDWMDFENGNDTLLRLSLALVYEKEQTAFNDFIKQRYDCNNLDEFLNSSKFASFKSNFKEIFYSLHRLESYLQSTRVGTESTAKSLVEMDVYKEKVKEVLKDVYQVLNYPEASFPPNNPIYQIYEKAKEAISKKDIREVVYQSQKLLDAFSCYEFRWKGFRIPNIRWPEGRTDCRTKDLTDANYGKLKGDTAIKLTEIQQMSALLGNGELMYGLKNEWMCTHYKARNKGGIFRRPMRRYQKRSDSYAVCGDYKSAMDVKIGLMGKIQLCIFRYHDWKLYRRLNKLRKVYERQVKLRGNKDYLCYIEGEEKLGNRFAFGSSRREVSQLLNFFTDVTKATDSKQLSQVIEKYAEPPQSYRVKRYNNFSMDINAWPGVYGGVETRAGEQLFANSVTKMVSGITAPIGLSFSMAGRVKFKCEHAGKRPVYVNRASYIKSFLGGSFSLNLMIIDIGAVVAYRFSKDADEGLPQTVNFAQVLAPGAYVNYGLRGLPLAIQVGGQYAPQLRTFGDTGLRPLDAYRVSIGIVYDIPLLNITNSNRLNKRIGGK